MTDTKLPTWWPAAQARHDRSVDVMVIYDAAGRVIRAGTFPATSPSPPPRRAEPRDRLELPYPEKVWLRGGRGPRLSR